MISVLREQDLTVLARAALEISLRRAALFSAFCFGVALLFGKVHVSLPFIAAAVIISSLALLWKTRCNDLEKRSSA